MVENFDAVGFVNNLLDKRIAEFVKKYPEKHSCSEVVMMEELKHEINLAYADYLDRECGENVSAALDDIIQDEREHKLDNLGVFEEDDAAILIEKSLLPSGEIPRQEYKFADVTEDFMSPPEDMCDDVEKFCESEIDKDIQGMIGRAVNWLGSSPKQDCVIVVGEGFTDPPETVAAQKSAKCLANGLNKRLKQMFGRCDS